MFVHCSKCHTGWCFSSLFGDGFFPSKTLCGSNALIDSYHHLAQLKVIVNTLFNSFHVLMLFLKHGFNGSNDVYDFDTGADKNKKESVVNMVGR